MENLAVICPDVAFKIEYYDTDEQFGAEQASWTRGKLYARTGSREDGYVFAVNLEKMQEVWSASVLAELLSLKSFMDAFIISELSVLKYEQHQSLTGCGGYRHTERLQSEKLYFCVYKSLLRKFCEYKLARELPEFGKALALLNMAVRPVGWLKLAQELPCRNELKALDSFLQYGTIGNMGVLPGFYDFMVPLSLAAIRTEMTNVLTTTQLLTDWLLGLELNAGADEAKEEEQAGFESGSVSSMAAVKVVSAEELCEIVRKENIRELRTQMQNAATQVGKLAGAGRFLSRGSYTAQFFLDTVRKYHYEISELEYMFRQSFTAMKIIAAYDGDVNLKKQQEAYLASKTGEESKVYQYYLKRRVSVDIMILRDVSGSTYRFEREYAEAIVEILAAVNNFEGIRTLVIDFESGAVLRKSFDMKAEQTSIVPLSGGGTNMLPAVQLLEEQKLKGRRRLLFVLSDGEINDREAAERELTAYCSRNQIEQIKLTFDEGDKYGYEHTTIINLHKFIAQKIVEKGIDY